jgi:hypothetical protein
MNIEDFKKYSIEGLYHICIYNGLYYKGLENEKRPFILDTINECLDIGMTFNIPCNLKIRDFVPSYIKRNRHIR